MHCMLRRERCRAAASSVVRTYLWCLSVRHSGCRPSDREPPDSVVRVVRRRRWVRALHVRHLCPLLLCGLRGEELRTAGEQPCERAQLLVLLCMHTDREAGAATGPDRHRALLQHRQGIQYGASPSTTRHVLCDRRGPTTTTGGCFDRRRVPTLRHAHQGLHPRASDQQGHSEPVPDRHRLVGRASSVQAAPSPLLFLILLYSSSSGPPWPIPQQLR